jgi:uncharacterized protein YfaS (alpha-2-macroglobulin family)
MLKISSMFVLLSGLLMHGLASAAVEVRDFSPQGEVRKVNQATAIFNVDMVKLGDAEAAAPFDIDCPVSGEGRWQDSRTWVYRLSGKLDAGAQCQFTPRRDLKSLDGEAYTGTTPFRFFMAGPWLKHVLPESYNPIEEDQVFIVETPFALKPQSVEQHAWCAPEGVSERIPVRTLSAAQLKTALQTLQLDMSSSALGLRCQRPLAPGSRMQLVWDAGIESISGGKSTQRESVTYQVRPVFRAELSCTREKPNAPCSPLSDIELRFSESVSLAQLEQIRLVGAGKSQAPMEISPARAKALNAQRPGAASSYRVAEQDQLISVLFKGPFKPDAAYELTLPRNLRDASGRTLSNASSFPLKLRTALLSPLAKFAANFGVLELKEGGVLPVTIRNMESRIGMRVLRQQDPEVALQVMADLRRFESQTREVNKPSPRMKQRTLYGDTVEEFRPYTDMLYPRELSFLEGRYDTAPERAMPRPANGKAFEVVGIPLQKPGFYVVEIRSQVLGNALLSEAKPMYVRSQALVTDMAVHLKTGRDNSLVWVTSLSSGKPVAGADVALLDCQGHRFWQGKTDAQGIAGYSEALPEHHKCPGAWVYFATAKLGEDFSFVQSDWDRGIEPWRFNVRTWAPQQGLKMQTILDRTMLRAGETVSMKHIARMEDFRGFRYPNESLPDSVTLELIGGDYSVDMPLEWDARGDAITQWQIPEDAPIGSYGIKMAGQWDYVGQFRVSEFRLPAYKGSVQSEKMRYAGASAIPVRLSLNYLNGGAASGQQVQVSAMLNAGQYSFADYPDFSFGGRLRGEPLQKLVLDRQAVKLDRLGSGRLQVPVTAVGNAAGQPLQLQTEMTFTDPNGEIQTLAGSTDIWPASLALGLQVKDWAGMQARRKVQAVVLDTAGKPRAGVKVTLHGERKWDFVHRKRILGGFYSYETEQGSEDLGTLCQGVSDAQGLVQCQVDIKGSGRIALTARAVDDAGRPMVAESGFWVSDAADIWYAQGDQDRMEVIPEKREYKVGETARLQVHTPFHQATALIAVEREGIIKTMVRTLYRRNAVVEIPIEDSWGPNVYVSVLAVRGRLTEVPWYSFFQWGWHSPVDWWQAWRDGMPQPTALVDLGKPAFKFGLTHIAVGTDGARLKVDVQTDRQEYRPRDMVTAKIKVRLPNGKPAPASAEVALVAVDRALLELSPNSSWNLLDNMMDERAYLINTASAQMQVVGKRHYGKKALPAGGGGGKFATRELFNTLLYWNPRVKLDNQGMATVRFRVNDALTAFKVVAIADVDQGYFGTGQAEIVSRQALQLTSGLPPMVRENDRYQASITLRNTTAKPMSLKLNARTEQKQWTSQAVTLAAGAAQELRWPVEVPDNSTSQRWTIEALDDQGKPLDRLEIPQKVLPRVPVTVQQASFMQLEQPLNLPTTLPAGAIPGKGGLQLKLSASLGQQTAGIERYFNAYPFNCLEQQTSIATGLMDATRWQTIAKQLAGYQDAQGYLAYFPGMSYGSDALTAYVLTMAYENAVTLPPSVEQGMRTALLDFVEGRSQPHGWYGGSNRYLNERRLSALAALSYTGSVHGRSLEAFEFKPIQMPTTSLIDWYAILRHVPDASQRDERLQQVSRELRNRLQNVGGRLSFDGEENDQWWWAMVDGEVNTTRLTALLMDDPGWKADMPAMLRGALMRQQKGHWHTTLANAWGRLALQKFSRQFESEPVSGLTQATLGAQQKRYDWPAQAAATGPDATAASLFLPWASAPTSNLQVTHSGTGKPWLNLLVTAAIPDKPASNGYRIQRRVTAIEQKVPGQWSRGDLMRIRVDVDSQHDLSWVVLTDPIPAGASILGNTARDSRIAQMGENQAGENQANEDSLAPSYTERGLAFFRAYYEFAPQGHFWYEYTVRLNNPGTFSLPPTRVEAMYAPEVFGQLPNGKLDVR